MIENETPRDEATRVVAFELGRRLTTEEINSIGGGSNCITRSGGVGTLDVNDGDTQY